MRPYKRKAFSLLFLLSACGTEAPPPEPGPNELAWSYESLTAEERAVVDHERDAAAWPAINQSFASAVREAAEVAP